ncbi:ATP-binding protein [Mycobacterium sp. 050134]|uniref:ATP-binding protein n=1 Tax=Mycobacterium sp. 050134 TaxID=3096111 RepID=UPI002EDA3D52
MMTAAPSCRECDTVLRPDARFCDACGAPTVRRHDAAEYKQVTVLFADLVRSMDIAAALGPERLREILTELVNRSAAVIRRYGGTVDKFTGDGIMALFGAPVALEDHALRACLAGLEIQDQATRLADDVHERDGVALRLRVGLNSGQVIAGGVGSTPLAYTAVGEHVGMAQRMESVAPPGGVVVSESTARLVEDVAMLGPRELVRIKGSDAPVSARRLVHIEPLDAPVVRAESPLVGRRWEVAAVGGVLDRSIDGHGTVMGVVGSPGIGKSRLVREAAAMASGRGVDVLWTFCESHGGEIPFHTVTRLLRSAFGVTDLNDEAARTRLRALIADADEQDLVLLDDLLGVRDPATALPKIDPAARRRRLTALVNAALLGRAAPTLHIVEDAHWIDEVSESMLVDFLMVIPQTPSMVMITYRPEYHGALSRVAGAQTIALSPLSDSEIEALVADALGRDPSVSGLGAAISARAAGNPFFAQEIIRDLGERGVLRGQRGAFVCDEDIADISVPATLQTAIAARIDRLVPEAKRTLSAAAVIGLRFDADLLTSIGVEPAMNDLIEAELIDQVRFTSGAEYAFHHPLIRKVAYESQLRSDRATLHRRLAAAIEGRDPALADANAALIAEHLVAARELHAAYGWHMRAGGWSINRDIAAARLSWESAAQVADALPVKDPQRTSMRITPRTLLCGSAWRANASIAGSRFDELRQLCELAGDKASLVIGMAGLVMEHLNRGRLREASLLASEYMGLIDAMAHPVLTIGLSFAAIHTKVETDEIADVVRWSDAVIDLADGDATKGNLVIGSPLALAFASRGFARWGLGKTTWRDDFSQAVAFAREADPMSYAIVIGYKYTPGIPAGVLLPDDAAMEEIGQALRIVEETGDDFGLALVRFALGLALVHRGEADRELGLQVLAQVREMCLEGRYTETELRVVDIYAAREQARRGDFDAAMPLLRCSVDELFDAGQLGWCNPGTRVLVETLLTRRTKSDVLEAEAAIERLEGGPAYGGLAMRQTVLLRLRALLARARGEEGAFRELVGQYRAMAQKFGYEGHLALADGMTSPRAASC